MDRFTPPPVHNVAHLLVHSADKLVGALIEYFDQGPGKFNYNPYRRLIGKALNPLLKVDALVDACYRAGSPSGFAQNAAVVRMLCDWARDRRLAFYDHPREQMGLGGNWSLPVPVDGYIVENDCPYFLWSQPRKTLNLGKRELAIIATCIRHLYCVDDFRNAGLIILDYSSPSGASERVLRQTGFDDLTLLEVDELGIELGKLAAALNQLAASGYRRPERRPSAPKPDDRQKDLGF